LKLNCTNDLFFRRLNFVGRGGTPYTPQRERNLNPEAGNRAKNQGAKGGAAEEKEPGGTGKAKGINRKTKYPEEQGERGRARGTRTNGPEDQRSYIIWEKRKEHGGKEGRSSRGSEEGKETCTPGPRE